MTVAEIAALAATDRALPNHVRREARSVGSGRPRRLGTVTELDVNWETGLGNGTDQNTDRDDCATEESLGGLSDVIALRGDWPDLAVSRPVASRVFAIVRYEQGETLTIQYVVGMFGDAPSAERYAEDQGYPCYVVAPATMVIDRAVVSDPRFRLTDWPRPGC